MAALDPKDGGMASRKLWMTIGTSLLVFFSGVVAAWKPAFGTVLPTVVGGLLASLGVYCGVNVTNSWLTGKALVAQKSLNGRQSDTAPTDTEGETC